MTAELRVSIVIVTLNGKPHLERCLPALMEHVDMTRCETIVVDNGSDDGTAEWLLRRYPAVRVVANTENRGFAAAVNDGIRLARGAYILSLNNDTSCESDFIAPMLAFMEHSDHACVGIVGPTLLEPGGRRQASVYCEPKLWRLIIERVGLDRLIGGASRIPFRFGPYREKDQAASHEVEWISGACLLFRRACLDAIGLLSEEMPFGLDDLEIAVRARRAGWSVWYVADAELTHYRGGTRGGVAPRHVVEFVHWSYTYGMRTYMRTYWSPRAARLGTLALAAGAALRLASYSVAALLPVGPRVRWRSMAAAHRAAIGGAMGHSRPVSSFGDKRDHRE